MPAPARISVPFKQSTHLKSAPNSIPKTPTSIPRPKGRVVHRQRARGRLGDTESDDELVREPHSDSESDSATSTLDTDSVSESEPEDESKPDARVPSPSHSPLVNGEPASPTPSTTEKAPVFPSTLDWSDMVADENANGAAALPVIDFADFSSHTQAASPPPPAVTLSSSPPTAEHPQLSQSALANGSSPPTRKPGQSARQAYLTRLDNDPAYVPTLGQFWSHDDRLLDKDLRSLSGWWRGRWQGRGRPRGRGGFRGGWGMRGARGRGGSVNGGLGGPFAPEDAPEEDALRVDGAWTHDGFEEMKQAEEERRQQFQFRGKNASSRGRGGFRGGFFGRDGLSSARTSSPHGSFARPQSESSTSDTLKFGSGGRPWFSMKPERVWTKQFDGYLYFEAQLKPVHNQGLGQGVRVKLPRQKDKKQDVAGPGGGSVIVRLPQRSAIPSRPLWASAKDLSPERTFVVKLPSTKGAGKERAHLIPEDVTTVTPPPMDEPVPTLRSAPVPSVQRPLTQEAPTFTTSHPLLRRASDVVVSLPSTSTVVAPVEHPAGAPLLCRHTSNELSTSGDLASAGPSHLDPQSVPQEGAHPAETAPPQGQPPVLPTVQTVAPPFQASPPYGSPYGYAASGLPLPPGIAVSESGVTFEIATGRTVFLHTPPPPPPPPQMQVPMYNPRPVPMHHTTHGSVHFLPHHGHASSMSLSASPPAFSSSLPIFALPRQSSRIEIKAPSEEKGTERAGELDRPGGDGRLTGSRTTVNVNAEPFTPAAHPQLQSPGYYPVESQQAFDEGHRHHQPHPSMSYQPAPYYFLGPDGSASYGYQYPNIDARQPQQQYESYAQDTYPQQHAIYY